MSKEKNVNNDVVNNENETVNNNINSEENHQKLNNIFKKLLEEKPYKKGNKKTRAESPNRILINSQKVQIMQLVNDGLPIQQIHKILESLGYSAAYPTTRAIITDWKKEIEAETEQKTEPNDTQDNGIIE